MKRFLCFAVSVTIVLASVDAGAQEVPVELPQGFSIQKVAGNELVPDASAMTVDPDGRPIVSGPGYVRRLIDDDGDGVFDRFEAWAEIEGVAQGIWFDGEQMWMTVDGAIKRSVDKKVGEPFQFEDVVPITTDKEHGSHAIRKGPDGWWYVLSGNATEIREQYHSLLTSPVTKPRAGFLMRFPADFETGEKFQAEIVCHGFRNAYDFDFDNEGRIYVYDSDGERDVSLPWYRPTRIYRVRRGDDAGWVSASWKRPASFFDMPDLVGELGRGSPTGVAVCDVEQFGPEYDQAVFVGDWTFGRIGVVKRGGKVEIFAKPKGNFGFAITDVEFSSQGDLLVTTGGRGTEGALYRIRRTSETGSKEIEPPEPETPSTIAMREYLDQMRNRAAEISKPTGRNAKPANEVFLSLLSDTLTQSDAALPAKVRIMQLALGGCNGDRMFAGHQAEQRIEFSEVERQQISKQLRQLLDRIPEPFELARLIGMLELNDAAIADSLSKVAAKEEDPVKRIHYLNCLAVAKGRMSLPTSDRVADSLLRVRREIDAAELPVDRNWQPRMGQLASELFRNMNIPEAIVKDVSFGQPSDMWIYDSLPEIFRGIARAKIAGKIQQDPKTATRKQLQCLSVDPQHVALIRSFADEDEFTDVVVMAINSTPVEGDRGVLMRGLKSFSLTVNKAALIGLRKIEGDEPKSDDFASLLQLERQLGWTNPEVSVRDQIVKLLQKWTGQSFGYEFRQYDLQADPIRRQRVKIDRWKNYMAAERSIKIEAAASVSDLIERYSKIDFSKSDSARGKLAYKKYQCAACHDGGGQNSGPSLAGITSRFSTEDVLRAIVDPNDNVPDRYRAVVVATEGGQLFRGSVVYESMAGIMLATSTGEVVRIDAAEIESRQKSTKSLMPEGLLNEASDQEVADLWAYLRGLK